MIAWFQAQIRWAVMEEGKRSLLRWQESAYIFLSDDHETAFHQALDVGRRGERRYKEGRRLIEVRLAEIVALDRLGPSPSEFLVDAGSRKASEHLPFAHVFNPESAIPPPSF